MASYLLPLLPQGEPWMNKPPEDSPDWKEMAPEILTPVVLNCRICKKDITLWHCADSGCCWCAECGTNSNPPRL